MTTTFSPVTSWEDIQIFPTSFAQQCLHDRLDSNGATHNMAITIYLRGLLDVGTLERSLNAISQRHAVLRTTFTRLDDQPVQVVVPTLPVLLPLIDLRHFPEFGRDAEVSRLVEEEIRQPFNLALGPLVRATLLRLKEEEYVLLLTSHSIIFDDWSANVLIRELAALYESFSQGKPSVLQDLPIQYADYACLQRKRLQGDAIATQRSYWEQQLSGTPLIPQLPTDHPRTAAQTFERAEQTLELPKTLREALEKVARQEGATLFTVVLAAFQILLQRYTGQEDLVVGSSITNRTQAELEGLIGCFANTLPLRTNLSGTPTFRELLERVREVYLGACTHADLPFEQLAEELLPEGSQKLPSTFDVIINFITAPQTTWDCPGLTISSLQIAGPASTSSMTLYVEAKGSSLNMRLVYQPALFLPERIARILDQLHYLLEQIAVETEKQIQLYSLVMPSSLHLLPDPRLVLPEPRYELITGIFASWAQRTPEQPAICQGNRAWTYRELAETAYTLARYLLAQRLELGDAVAILGRQSFGLIASMIAVLLAGGVLLPIDWSLPVRRQQMMLQESKAKHLFYLGNWRPEDIWVQELPSSAIHRVDPDKGRVVEPKGTLDIEAAQLPALSSEAAVYIFFTSGTTGVPKGVLGCHKGLSHFLSWQREKFAVGPHDRCAQLTNLSFDPVLREIFLPLTSGGTLCLPREPDTLGPDRILRWLERERISLLHTVPALAQSWLTNSPPDVSLQGLRWTFFAGEPLTDALVNLWRETFPKANRIVNLYGPTETTLAKCFYIVPSNILEGVQPAGWPQPETQALVLAGNNQLCGIGELGEIVLRTPFRTLGYINAPEENRKRFIKNPFRDDESDVLYRTGDRGRYRLDGSLDVLGRLDYQVKIRGVRVEPYEVMTILQRHPSVKSCVVVAQKDEQDQNFLVAYVAPPRQGRVTGSELRAYLSKQLPPPMVPSYFVLLEDLPLMPNGKVERRALPPLDQVKLLREESPVAPRTPVEKELAGIWAEALGLEQVGIYDNFFELGGHSLLATQIIARLRSPFQIELPLRSFFQAPTVARLAEVVTQMKASSTRLHVPTLRARSREAYQVQVSSTLSAQGGVDAQNQKGEE